MTPQPGGDAPRLEGPAIPVCPKCLAEVRPRTDFCPGCRSPLTSYANTGYFESALAEGWGLGEAIVSRHPSLVTLIGLWLIVAPLLVGFSLQLAPSFGEELLWLGLVGRLVAATVVLCLAWALFHATRNYVRARRNPPTPPSGADPAP